MLRLFLLSLLALLSAVVFGYAAVATTAADEDEGYGLVVEIVPSVCGCETVLVYVGGHPEVTISATSGGAAVLPMGVDLLYDVTWACVVSRDALKREPVVGPRRVNNMRGTSCVVRAAEL